jgi:hypothetical protein
MRPAEIHQPPDAWAELRLGRLDTRSTARLTLSLGPGSGLFWRLEQAGRALATIKRASGGVYRLRTASEQWRAHVRRRDGRLGWWLLVVPRAAATGSGVTYYPHSLPLLPGGRLVVRGGRHYRLRSPVVRADWRLTAAPWGREAGRIAFRGHRSPKNIRKFVAFREEAPDERLLLLLFLAASVAILVHDEQDSTGDADLSSWEDLSP